jgi:uncharacterized metal-binding protein YceD (DUF177 family)
MCSNGMTGLSEDDVLSLRRREKAPVEEVDAREESEEEPECEAVEGLNLSRRELESEMGARVLTVRLRRKSNLSEVGVSDLGNGNTKVSVHLAVQPARGDYRVVGRVATRVVRACDRCLNDFEAPSDGRFELWLSTSTGGLTEEEELEHEAVETFCGARAEVDLAPHVRDAVYLSLPTKALCSSDCAGITVLEPSTRDPSRSSNIEGAADGTRTEHERPPRASDENAGVVQEVPAGSVEVPDPLPEDLASDNALLALKRKFEEHNNQRGRRGM